MIKVHEMKRGSMVSPEGVYYTVNSYLLFELESSPTIQDRFLFSKLSLCIKLYIFPM